MSIAILIRPYRNKVSSPKARNMIKYFDLIIYWFEFTDLIFCQFAFKSPPRKWDFLSVQKQKSPCKSIDLQGAISVSLYPERGSNPHAFQHRCLRPTCLPIPTSGRKAVAKVIVFFGFCKLISKNFADRYKISNFALIIRKVFKVFRF